MCGSTSKCSLYYEYIDHNLESEITKRHKHADHFQEMDIWNLINSLVSVFKFLQINHMAHGQLKPANIYLSSTGTIKVGEISLLNPQAQ